MNVLHVLTCQDQQRPAHQDTQLQVPWTQCHVYDS